MHLQGVFCFKKFIFKALKNKNPPIFLMFQKYAHCVEFFFFIFFVAYRVIPAFKFFWLEMLAGT